MRIFFIALYICCICTLTVGCGTKGHLYIPEKQYPQETPAKN